MADEDVYTGRSEVAVASFTFPPELAHEALPGGGEVADELLEEAVRRLNRQYALSGLAMMRAMAEIVIDLFAGGDVDAFRVAMDKHVTWAALARHEGLHIEAKELRRCVQTYYLLLELPQQIGEALSPTHHRSLIGVEDPAKRLALARSAYTRQLTTRQLDEEIANDPDQRTKRGPKPKSPTRKLTEAIDKLTASLKSTRVDDADPDEAEALVESLKAFASAVQVVRAAAERRYVVTDE